MTKYIDKSKIVAEIERRKSQLQTRITELGNFESNTLGLFQEVDLYDDIISFLDTLEPKEVDLEAEFDNYTKDILACDVQFEPFTHLHNCAKYFFELGLKAKGE